MGGKTLSKATDFAFGDRVGLETHENVFHECGSVEDRNGGVHEGDHISGDLSKMHSTKQNRKLFLQEHRVEILQIHQCEVPIFPFKIVVNVSCKGVWLLTKFPRAKTNYHIEGSKVFGPTRLTMGEGLGCSEILQVLVVSNYVNGVNQQFEVMSPNLEGFEDC